eukprot:CAMPEP_0185188024 /NCGR_PEP_ID=MMETSP1140-20130426/5141_1 /TAXON_ID=298111 /ORGANISM="Pavlova sp., Strain CCMP459" /LENGTH=112 /DNA_ID=CAMNT_0027754493 /DNA_START=76 /DNA_END=411 /DNA_ORIENTATION=-
MTTPGPGVIAKRAERNLSLNAPRANLFVMPRAFGEDALAGTSLRLGHRPGTSSGSTRASRQGPGPTLGGDPARPWRPERAASSPALQAPVRPHTSSGRQPARVPAGAPFSTS